MRKYVIDGFRRISKAQAKRIFMQGDKPLYVCPVKMCPGMPWNMACLVFGKEYIERSQSIHNGQISAWDLMYDSWAFYNTSWETGYYASYWVK